MSSQVTVEELEPKQAVLVFPTGSVSALKGPPGAPCPCTCYELDHAVVQNSGTWTGTLSQGSKNNPTDYRGYEMSTGITYIGKDNSGIWNWEPTAPYNLDGGTI
jgi:hypothetical protein